MHFVRLCVAVENKALWFLERLIQSNLYSENHNMAFTLNSDINTNPFRRNNLNTSNSFGYKPSVFGADNISDQFNLNSSRFSTTNISNPFNLKQSVFNEGNKYKTFPNNGLCVPPNSPRILPVSNNKKVNSLKKSINLKNKKHKLKKNINRKVIITNYEFNNSYNGIQGIINDYDDKLEHYIVHIPTCNDAKKYFKPENVRFID